MEKSPIEIISPTSSSWQGMQQVLFRPFDIGKWFVLGFTAWLAALVDGSFSSGGSGGNFDTSDTASSPQSLEDVWDSFSSWVSEHLATIIIVGGIIFAIVLAIWLALLWVSSRGKFMFLDNIIHNRTMVKEPWFKFREIGNSLFRWRICFTLITTTIALALVGGTVILFAGLQAGQELMIPGLVIGGLLLVIFMLIAGYIGVLLEDFVIPLMYRDGTRSTEAWKKFLSIHSTAFGSFLLYFLWRFLLSLGTGIVILTLGFATCCIGFVIMAIPYLGTVLLLPVAVFFRFLGPAFLRQFGSEFDAFQINEAIEEPTG